MWGFFFVVFFYFCAGFSNKDDEQVVSLHLVGFFNEYLLYYSTNGCNILCQQIVIVLIYPLRFICTLWRSTNFLYVFSFFSC
jgi:hypothetical protein